MLKAQHPFAFDARVRFVEKNHAYIVDGAHAPRSVTALVKTVEPPSEAFNPDAVIRKNLQSWKDNASSKYHQVVQNKSDEQASRAIKRLWTEANQLGTRMHKAIELRLNDAADASVEASVRCETDQISEILRRAKPKWTPYRTEVNLFGLDDDSGQVFIAGCADAIFRDEENDSLVMVDFKRTDKDLGRDAHAFGRRFIGALEGTALNDHMKYSLQLHVYKALFEALTAREGNPLIIGQCFILQAHPELPAACLTEATDLSRPAGELLEWAKAQAV